ncbi:MAG: hypothetical protein A2511_11645 [Deltaproteobacteria bacterium RIFOXYD12_FULL_50_9]|nr:MAG: hypothetical protein A2511_11645 [Deltaproteobacteria bacterium RIFOXYD12_FULL_50_9]
MFDKLAACRLCPRACGVDRRLGKGFCGAGENPVINLWHLHMGEEPVLSGVRGSGTIFFSHCNLHCVYCQNYVISQQGCGSEYSVEELGIIMLFLASQGAHNVNLVTPTHFTPQIRAAIIAAREKGFRLPVVWNSSAYELPETLHTLDGLVDIYLPDFRYSAPAAARLYSGAIDYPERARSAILEMFRQTGHLQIDAHGIAVRGLICRLLVLPGNVNRVDLTLKWIADHLGPETAISLMAQYYPTYRAVEFPEINRALLAAEFEEIVEIAEDLGFENGFIQEVGATPEWTPEFG